jgi:nucleotide-binding universal stress UspA family protein
MNRGPTAPIVVAIDVARPAENVVEWAAAEAATQGSPLRIVHAIAPEFCLDPSMASAMFEYAAGSRAAAALLLRDAVTRATSVASELNVSATLLNGTVTWALRREARTARLLVVGHHHTRNGGLRGLLARSVARELAAHAPCPVVVVRHQDGPVAGAARVVVGVNRGPTSAAIGFGFQAARQRGVPLTLVHVCRSGPHHDRTSAGVDLPTFNDVLGDRAVAQAITRWQQECPEVQVNPTLHSGEPAAALIAESLGAALLVVGSRNRRRLVGGLRGSISQVALDHATCPLAVVGQDHATIAPFSSRRRDLHPRRPALRP